MRDEAHLRLMTKALMRMMRRTTLPTTDTSNTVELAPSPIMGAGTEEKGRKDGRTEKGERGEQGKEKEKGEDGWSETKEQSQYHCAQSSRCT